MVDMFIKATPIGILLLVIIAFNFIRAKHTTLSLMIMEVLLTSIVGSLFFGYFCLIYGVLSIVILGFIKIKLIPDLDFGQSISSVMGIINKFTQRKVGKGFKTVGKIQPFNKDTLPLNNKLVQMNNTISCGGTLITGSTGSGKTWTMKSMIYQDLLNGHSVSFFDYKGETILMDEFRKFCENHGIEFYEFSAQTIDFMYDPLINLNETGKIEAILNTRKWSMDGSDAHYRTGTQLFIQKIIQAYDKFRQDNNIPQSENYVNGLYIFSKTFMYNQSEREAYLTVNKMLELLLTSNARKLFGLDGDKKIFTFEKQEQYMVCFSFMSSNKELANTVSSFVYKDLLDTGNKREYVPGLALYIDEFGTLENSMIIKDILEKGRSGGVQTTFSILDINQISLTVSPFFLQSILGIINTFIIHAGATKSTAETLSGVQIDQMDKNIQSLRKPYKGKPPTAIFISKYPIFNKEGKMDAYRIIPFIYRDNEQKTGSSFGESLKQNLSQIKNDMKVKEEKQLEEVILDDDIQSDINLDIKEYYDPDEDEMRDNGDTFKVNVDTHALSQEELKQYQELTKENNNNSDINDFL